MGLGLGPFVPDLHFCSVLGSPEQVGTIWFDILDVFWDLGGWTGYIYNSPECSALWAQESQS